MKINYFSTMIRSVFVSDLHGSKSRYNKLFGEITSAEPEAVFIGGDILPSTYRHENPEYFYNNVILKGFRSMKKKLKENYPKIFLILGNDDGKVFEEDILDAQKEGLWEYMHNRRYDFNGRKIFGYSFIPPTPFLLKDWEKYDVSRFTDPGCISPEEGRRSYDIEPNLVKYSTIRKDLDLLFGKENISDSVVLFHSPPYKTNLDRADLDGRYFDSVPLDVNVGSIAIREFIEERQPHLTLHGHIHESPRLTGQWKDRIGITEMFSAAHDGKELAMVLFDLDDPEGAERIIF
ncbi:MAG: metallophosphoesterase [Candidatus Delongbacteria bacterium]|nr:metallophosphoesterase [Candidatus Delongbacteria bacterium]